MNYLLQKTSEHIGGRGVRETDRPDENTVSDERMSAPFAHVVNCGESLSEARRGGPRHNTGTGSQLKKGDRFFVGRFHYLDHTPSCQFVHQNTGLCF